MPSPTCRSPKIEVATGGYTLTAGALTEDVTAASEVVLALRSRRGSSAVAPTYGSRLHTIRKLDKRSKGLARFHAIEALQFLVDRGAIRFLTVVVTRLTSGLRIVVSYRDRGGQPRTVDYTYRVTG